MIRHLDDIILHRIVVAIQALGERDWFDYLAVAAPLILSAIAIWISISTARKQNKIALLEIKCNVVHTMQLILAFGDGLDVCGCDEAVIDLFNATYGTRIDINPNGPIDATREAINRMHEVEKDLMAAQYVFPKENLKMIEKIWELEQEYICQVIESGRIEEQQEKIRHMCKEYEETQFKRIANKVRL